MMRRIRHAQRTLARGRSRSILCLAPLYKRQMALHRSARLRLLLQWSEQDRAPAHACKVAAPWVLSMLASLYWRIVGKPRNALDCLQLALDTVPDKFKDVPLVSVASISHKFSLVDNALSATQEAYKTNPVEVRNDQFFKRDQLFKYPIDFNCTADDQLHVRDVAASEGKLFGRDLPSEADAARGAGRHGRPSSDDTSDDRLPAEIDPN
ncbi:unnamed protein product [Trichogramma brassicae]|uniref:Uncharacterized protein n=1 Tax=Trichogramma brassicae TaxID=86971 RepID=A0A6H5IQ62_9HYME|nr:unnamed protein product [Trichogramma brassicae]